MKKEHNDKNYSAREAWMKRKKEGRIKQVWIEDGWAKLEAVLRDDIETK